MAALAEGEQTSILTERNINAAMDLAEKGITRLAICGEPDSPADLVARQLGIEDVQYHDTTAGVLEAAKTSGIAGLVPWKKKGERTHKPSRGAKANLEAIMSAELAMFTTVR